MTTSTPAETSPTLTPKSRTLLRLEKTPDTICAVCPNALWHTIRKGGKVQARVYCNLMHALIDQELNDCDGIPDEEPTMTATTTPAEPIKDFGLPLATEPVKPASADDFM